MNYKIFSKLKYKVYFFLNLITWVNSPYITNKYEFLIKLLLTDKYNTLKIKNYSLKLSSITGNIRFLTNLLRLLRFSMSFTISKSGMLNITLDNISWFNIDLNDKEGQKLVWLLSDASMFGLTVIDNNKKHLYFLDNKCIFLDDNIIETFDGVKSYLKYYNYGIIESFYNNQHVISTITNYKDKIVFDIGASVGDTALYFASQGAKVYSVEIDERNIKILKEHLKLNPDLSKRIKWVHAAFAYDGEVEYTIDPQHYIDSTIYDARFDGYFNKGIKKTITSYSIPGLLKLFGLKYVDYLKIDVKGAEFLLTKEDLINIKNLKIEYMRLDKKYNILTLIKLIKEAGFKVRTFNNEITTKNSLNNSGNIIATKEVFQ